MSRKSIKANVKIKCRNKTEPKKKKDWKLLIYMRIEQSNIPIGIDGG